MPPVGVLLKKLSRFYLYSMFFGEQIMSILFFSIIINFTYGLFINLLIFLFLIVVGQLSLKMEFSRQTDTGIYV